MVPDVFQRTRCAVFNMQTSLGRVANLLHVVLVIDISTSMKSAFLTGVKAAVRELIDDMSYGHHLTILTYTDVATVVVDERLHRHVDREALKRRVSGLVSVARVANHSAAREAIAQSCNTSDLEPAVLMFTSGTRDRALPVVGSADGALRREPVLLRAISCPEHAVNVTLTELRAELAPLRIELGMVRMTFEVKDAYVLTVPTKTMFDTARKINHVWVGSESHLSVVWSPANGPRDPVPDLKVNGEQVDLATILGQRNPFDNRRRFGRYLLANRGWYDQQLTRFFSQTNGPDAGTARMAVDMMSRAVLEGYGMWNLDGPDVMGCVTRMHQALEHYLAEPVDVPSGGDCKRRKL